MVGNEYKPCDACGADCDWLGESDEPCYGQVTTIEEVTIGNESDFYWVHACVGHAQMEDGKKYSPQPEGDLWNEKKLETQSIE